MNEVEVKISIYVEEMEGGEKLIRKLNAEIKLQSVKEITKYGKLKEKLRKFIEETSNKEEHEIEMDDRFIEEENIFDELEENPNVMEVTDKESKETSNKSKKRKRSEKTSNGDDQENKNKRRKLQDKMYNKLLEEILAPVMDKENSLEEIDESMRVGEMLIKRLYRAKYKEGEGLRE